MVPRPGQFGGTNRFGGSALQASSRAQQFGLGLAGKGRGGLKRHAKKHRDTIFGVTKGDIRCVVLLSLFLLLPTGTHVTDDSIRRLARRGGVKRISGTVYADIRVALKDRLQNVRPTNSVVIHLASLANA